MANDRVDWEWISNVRHVLLFQMENVPFMPNKYGLDSLFPVAKAFDDLFSIDFTTVKL